MLFTNIRAVINRLTIDRNHYQDDDIIEWIMNGLDILNIKKAYQQDAVLITVKNHKAILPCDLVQIDLVTSCSDKNLKLTEEEQDELNENLGFNEEREELIESNGNIKVIANYPRFSKSDFFHNYFTVMTLSNRPFAGKYHCSDCPNLTNNCGLEYTLSPNGYITTPFECGYICLAYSRRAKDEDGEYIIPDHEELIQALANWCMAKHWEIRMNMKEEGAEKMHDRYIQKAQDLFQKTRGIFTMKSFSFPEWKGIVFKNIKWSNSYTIFNKGMNGQRPVFTNPNRE